MRRRVVVTGMGAITSIGYSVMSSWKALLEGKSGIIKIDKLSEFQGITLGSAPKYAAIIPNKEKYIKNYRIPPFNAANTLFYGITLAATEEAIKNSGIDFAHLNEEQRYRAGVIIGTAASDKPEIEISLREAYEKGYNKMNRMSLLQTLHNFGSSIISIKYNLQGYTMTPVVACTSGLQAIGEGYRAIKDNMADYMIVGGGEHSVCPYTVQAFASIKALSTKFENQPAEASRPFDKQRDGFVLGDGAGILLLEEYEQALARKANILAEIKAYNVTSDAYHITKPNPDGNGLYRAIALSLKEAKLVPKDIDAVNAHAASTLVGDEAELKALERIFANKEFDKKAETPVHQLSIFSNKGNIGHTIGAAGAIETIFSILSMKHGTIPHTLNLHDPIPTKLNLVKEFPSKKNITNILKESIGFGGTNVALILSKVDNSPLNKTTQ